MSDHPFALYNPALLPAEVLLHEYTARRLLLEQLLGIVRGNAPGHPPQHALLIGARGMGKTTTLWAVAHRVSRDPELSRLWQPVVFDEESRRVGDLADFWLEALRQWEFATQDTASDRAGQLLRDNPPDIETRAQHLFSGLVRCSGRRALLLIDNLNDLFASIRDPEPLHRLRAILMQDSGIMLIGGATSYFEQVTSVDQPFFEFFRTFELKPLGLEEMRECLVTLARSHKDVEVEKILAERGGSIRALHLLTGGNPRLIKTFYRLLRGGLHTDIRSDLEKLIDEFTPYFKAIVDALPVQQQRIFDAVALAWNPLEVGSLATATRLPSNQVSAQLRALVKAGLIREAQGHPKKKAYLLADRFSNIHYLMRHGRAARNRLDWFVATIQVLFPDQTSEIIAKLAHDAAECGSFGLQDARDVLYSALRRSETTHDRQRLLHCTLEETWSAPAMAQLQEWFDVEQAKADLPEADIIAFCQHMPAELRKELGFKPQDARWWYQITDFLEERAAWQLAEAAYRKAIELGPELAIPWNGLGNLLQYHLQRPREAEAAYRKAIELNPEAAIPWNGLGNLLQYHLQRPFEAEAAYHRAIDLDSGDAIPWNGLGNLLQYQLHRPVEAEAVYRKAIELDPAYANPWNGLGNLLQDYLPRPAEAEVAYRKAIELDAKAAIPWNGLGNLLQKELLRPAEAEAAYRKAIELDPKFAMPWNGLGNLLKNQLRRPAEAESAYRKAIELDPEYANPWNGLGNLLQDYLPRPAEAEAAYRKAIGLDAKFAQPWAGLAEVLAKTAPDKTEARRCIMTSLLLKPEYGFARHTFLQLCQDHPEDWQSVLPVLFEWFISHPKASAVFDFIVTGIVRYAQLKTPAEALALFEKVSDATPFESIQDALYACRDAAVLHKLAPERQEVALEIMKRIQAPT